jgi:hypothetical protein
MASLFGSYVFVWGSFSLGVPLGVAIGMPYHDAETLLRMLAFPIFVGCFCWTFSTRSLSRVWLSLLAGGALMTVVGYGLAAELT